jgi:hypothetical protein
MAYCIDTLNGTDTFAISMRITPAGWCERGVLSCCHGEQTARDASSGREAAANVNYASLAGWLAAVICAGVDCWELRPCTFVESMSDGIIY